MVSDIDTLVDVVVETIRESLAGPLARISALEAELVSVKAAAPVPRDQSALNARLDAMDVAYDSIRQRVGMRLDLLDLQAVKVADTTKDAVAPFQARIAALESELVAVKAAVPAVPEQAAVMARLDALDTKHVAIRQDVDVWSSVVAMKAQTSAVEAVTDLVQGLETRLGVVETKAAVPGPKGEPGGKGEPGERGPEGPVGIAGKDVDSHAVQLAIDLAVGHAVATLPVPKDGEPGRNGEPGKDAPDVDLETLAKAAAALIPIPKDGATGLNGKDAENVDLEAVAKAAAALIPAPKDGEPGKDGQSVHVADVMPALVSALEKAIAEFPRPVNGRDGVDGQSVQVSDVAPVITAEVEKAVSAIPRPRDGVGLAGAVIDRDGHLVVTLTDGSTKALGPVVGEVDVDAVTRLITEKVAEFPRPKDGAPGRDGTLEHIKMLFDGERTVTFCFKDGTPVEGGTLKFPVVIYRGVYGLDGRKSYERCDSVTFGNQQWIAMEDTSEKPAEGKAWRLAVRAGRDGREGKQGPEGGRGPKGDKGDAGIFR